MLEKHTEVLEAVAIRFAGDSGDGMQLTGTQFTETTALAGNDLATFPDYPAEIRAPAGTIGGVSGFQLHLSSKDVFTPGDEPDVLVAMNPAALKVNLPDLKPGGILILNTEQFSDKNLERAGYKSNPLEDGSLAAYRVYPVDITGLTLKAIADVGLNQRAAVRCKNFFALGLAYWMFNRPLEHSIAWIEQTMAKKDALAAQANLKALKAGHAYGETAEIFTHSYVIPEAKIAPGKYKNITGNEGVALGLLAAMQLSGLDMFLGTYPITPATDILHHLSKYKHLGVKTFQAEDEIAGICSAIGAAYAGGLAVTTTSGPGLALKSEAMNLALMLELPLVIVNVQRGGPSTGLPTKTEQSDLMQALYGRNGESPIPVIAARSPGDCFDAAIEAVRIAIRSMTPVLLLTDGYLANGSEPWRIPKLDELPRIPVHFHTEPNGFQPYGRDDRLARPWAIPGTPGLEHRIGGLEKANLTGAVSYDGGNHELMCKLRAEKIRRIADIIPPTEVHGALDGDVLVVGWGGTYGAIRAGVDKLLGDGHRVAHVHLRHLNPLPADLGAVLHRFKKVLVPELNLGQLSHLLRDRYLIDAVSYNKVQGKPFKESEIARAVLAELERL
ncbi:2-oxoacid:acceptor oxidoreductase subunit alpha [Myxococcota bacterium]|jgi:2-oxoglutarate ferredoxin oxidoreductase subunit alpha|nr:2-oxoacid:acceptor oxidoreductase subunit alpha [Myxococcota bacterium]